MHGKWLCVAGILDLRIKAQISNILPNECYVKGYHTGDNVCQNCTQRICILKTRLFGIWNVRLVNIDDTIYFDLFTSHVTHPVGVCTV